MLSEIELKKIHQELNKLLAPAKVFLGGSYSTGRADENSDIDFYIVAGWLGCWRLWQKKEEIKTWKARYSKVVINIMIVPQFFVNRGWYYVKGVDATGAMFESPINYQTIFRNALKLSGFYFLLHRQSEKPEKKQYWLNKAGKQLMIAKSAAAQNLGAYSGNRIDNFSKEWIGIYNSQTNLLGFSFANWLIYNCRFISKGCFKFILTNPDYLILKQISRLISDQATLGELKELKRIVFPVYII